MEKLTDTERYDLHLGTGEYPLHDEKCRKALKIIDEMTEALASAQLLRDERYRYLSSQYEELEAENEELKAKIAGETTDKQALTLVAANAKIDDLTQKLADSEMKYQSEYEDAVRQYERAEAAESRIRELEAELSMSEQLRGKAENAGAIARVECGDAESRLATATALIQAVIDNGDVPRAIYRRGKAFLAGQPAAPAASDWQWLYECAASELDASHDDYRLLKAQSDEGNALLGEWVQGDCPEHVLLERTRSHLRVQLPASNVLSANLAAPTRTEHRPECVGIDEERVCECALEDTEALIEQLDEALCTLLHDDGSVGEHSPRTHLDLFYARQKAFDITTPEGAVEEYHRISEEMQECDATRTAADKAVLLAAEAWAVAWTDGLPDDEAKQAVLTAALARKYVK